jgi:uracil-DNA glycosylase family 4
MEDASEKLDQLARSEKQCTKCEEIVACRLRAVCGAGHPHAAVMFVSLCPSPEDEAADKPAGSALLENLTAYLPGLGNGARDRSFMTTILKCVPRSGDRVRSPRDDEKENCFAFLSTEISITTPHYLVPVGEQAARYLVGKLFHEHGPDAYDPLALRVYDSPTFRVVPIASPDEIAGFDAKTKKEYTERLHSLAALMGL